MIHQLLQLSLELVDVEVWRQALSMQIRRQDGKLDSTNHVSQLMVHEMWEVFAEYSHVEEALVWDTFSLKPGQNLVDSRQQQINMNARVPPLHSSS